MGDFLLLTLVIALSFIKLILFALLIVVCWIYIKKHSPQTAESIQNAVPKYKKES